MVVAGEALAPSSILDTRLRLLPQAHEISDGLRVRLLLGTSEVMAVCTVLSADTEDIENAPTDRLPSGKSGLVQLRTETPLIVLPGDRFVLRRESPVETLGGGEVLDPWAKRIRRRDKAVSLPRLLQIEAGDPMAHLLRAGLEGLDPSKAGVYGVQGLGRLVGTRLLHPQIVAQLEKKLLSWLAVWHRANPLALGCPRKELHSGCLGHLEKRAFEDLLVQLVEASSLVLEGPRLRLPAFEVCLNPAQEERLDDLVRELRQQGCATPKIDTLVEREPDLVPLLMNRGQLQRVGDRLVHHDALQTLTAEVRSFLETHGQMGPTDFKAITGLSRRHAIPLLEWLDAQGVTLRQENFRVLRRS
jgi:selenocysteine-specific elongation factor